MKVLEERMQAAGGTRLYVYDCGTDHFDRAGFQFGDRIWGHHNIRDIRHAGRASIRQDFALLS